MVLVTYPFRLLVDVHLVDHLVGLVLLTPPPLAGKVARLAFGDDLFRAVRPEGRSVSEAVAAPVHVPGVCFHAVAGERLSGGLRTSIGRVVGLGRSWRKAVGKQG